MLKQLNVFYRAELYRFVDDEGCDIDDGHAHSIMPIATRVCGVVAMPTPITWRWAGGELGMTT
jgi:hypothetical protein